MGVTVKKVKKAKENKTLPLPFVMSGGKQHLLKDFVGQGVNSQVEQELKTAVGVITTNKKGSSPVVSTSEEAVAYGPGPFCSVGVKGSRTINLGNYESVRVEIVLFVPCVPVADEINNAFGFASAWVDEKMIEQVSSMSITTAKPE